MTIIMVLDYVYKVQYRNMEQNHLKKNTSKEINSI